MKTKYFGLLFLIYSFVLFFFSCGNENQSKVENLGGMSSGGFSGNSIGGNGNSSGTFNPIIIDSGIDAQDDVNLVYNLPSDFTKGEFGGYKLGPLFDPNMTIDGGINNSSCGYQIIGIVRDFRGFNEANGHPDFEHFAGNSASLGIVKSDLGTDQKPIYNGVGPIIDPNNGQQTTSLNYFNQWYNNVDGVNLPYVIYFYFEPNNGILTFSSDEFFPLDNSGFGNTPGQNHNFSFTTEVHTKFNYLGGETFSFTGDDDVWVFINGKLAVDIGGVHIKISKSINLDNIAVNLGIVKGNNYSLDVFQSERHTIESHYRIDTNLEFTDCGELINPPK